MLRFGALGLVLIIAPSFKLGIAHRFFSWIPYSSRNILSNSQDFLQPVRLVGIQFSRFSRFIESASIEHWFLVIILIISPFSELGIAYRFFFMDSLLFQKHSIKFSRFFAIGSTGWHPVQPVHRVSWCRTLIFGNYFDHIFLFRTRNCVPFFFMDSSLFKDFFATGSTSWHLV